jgi:hypothetical protein
VEGFIKVVAPVKTAARSVFIGSTLDSGFRRNDIKNKADFDSFREDGSAYL